VHRSPEVNSSISPAPVVSSLQRAFFRQVSGFRMSSGDMEEKGKEFGSTCSRGSWEIGPTGGVRGAADQVNVWSAEGSQMVAFALVGCGAVLAIFVLVLRLAREFVEWSRLVEDLGRRSPNASDAKGGFDPIALSRGDARARLRRTDWQCPRRI